MNSRKVVVVSDEWTTTDLWSQNVKGSGTGVDLVDFGASPTWMSTLDRYDLAIVDINGCDDTGSDVCRSLREVSDLPILVLTYDLDERTHLKFYRDGVDECIVKPIGIPLMLAKVRAWLRRCGENNDNSPSQSRWSGTMDTGVRGFN